MIWLIFVPVLAMSLWLLTLAGAMVVRHLASQSWQPVDATLIDLGTRREQLPGGRGDAVIGTSRLTGRYTYALDGQTFTSDRISFSSMLTRSIGGRFDDWNERLTAALGEPGGTITVWVNPDKPAEAVVLRDIRWSEMALLLGFGLMLLWASTHFLFATGTPVAAPQYSWRAVGVMWGIGASLAVLVPLLWRDGHPVWAVALAMPLLLAINGTLQGLRQ